MRTLHFLILMMLMPAVLRAENPATLTVTQVVDGDTFWGTDAGGQRIKVRLIGVDAPESRKTGNKPEGFYGKEAKAYLTRLLMNQRVRLAYDKSARDRYGRTLAYVYLADGTFVNDLLVQKGYAKAIYYKPNGKYREQLSRSCKNAQQSGAGMWQQR